MRAHLIQIDATTTAGAAATVYLSSVDDARVCHLNGAQWVPAIARLPSLRYDFFGGDFGGAITTPSASFSVAIEGVAGFTGLRFSRARFRLWTGELGGDWASYTLRFDGRISAEPQLSAGMAQFDAGPDDAWLDKPFLSLYAGTGGIEGPDDLEGRPKPLVLGEARFAPGVQIDAVDNVWQVSAYGAVQGIAATYDRVVAIGGPTANYANLAALLAASIPNGSFATCNALGLARLGAPPDGQVSFSVAGDNAGAGGYALTAGEMIRRIAEIAGGTVNTANLAALDTARPYDLALVVTEQTTARELIQRICDSVCAVAGVTWTGTLFVQPLGYTTPTLTLASDGTALPPVASVEVQPVAAPFWRLATEAEVTWLVHSTDQVASEFVIRGLYNASRVYRLDDMVSSEDGSAWVYINAAPSAGNAPPTWPTTSNSWWQNVGSPTAADWDLITGAGKPEDNATVGAPAGTLVAGVPAEDLVAAVGEAAPPSIALSRPTATLWAYENGLVIDYAPASGQLKVWAGGVDVTASATLSATATNCTGTINTATNTPVSGQPKGYYRVTDVSADNATLALEAIYGSATLTAQFNVTRIRAGIQIVTSLPSTDLFDGRTVTYDDRLHTYRTGSGWVQTIDVDSALDGAMLDPGTVVMSKLVVVPQTIIPDPEFKDEAYWTGGGSTASGWIFAPYGAGASAATLGTEKAVEMSGANVGTIKQMSSAWLPYAGPGQMMRLRCRAVNYMLPNIYVAIEFRDPTGSSVTVTSGTPYVVAATSFGPDNLSTQFQVPNGASQFRVIIRNDAGTTNGGWSAVGSIKLDIAASAELIVDGDVLARHLASNSVTTDKLNAGAVVASKMSVTQLDAITATIGTLRTATSGARQEIHSNQTLVYDSSNVLRIRQGVW